MGPNGIVPLPLVHRGRGRSVQLNHMKLPFLGTKWLTVDNFIWFNLELPSRKA